MRRSTICSLAAVPWEKLTCGEFIRTRVKDIQLSRWGFVFGLARLSATAWKLQIMVACQNCHDCQNCHNLKKKTASRYETEIPKSVSIPWHTVKGRKH